jgi:hypothetical protein
VRDLRQRDIRTKSRLLATGATRGGVPFGRGSLFYLLRNRFYVGEVKYKDEILPGEQPAIMDRAVFDAVQQKLTDQWTTRSTTRNASDHLLTGLLFDDAGHRMVPAHATKAGIRYRYYVSLPHLHGESKTASVGSVSRVPATDIENIIVKSLNEHLIAQKENPAFSLTHVRDGKSVLEQVAPDRCAGGSSRSEFEGPNAVTRKRPQRGGQLEPPFTHWPGPALRNTGRLAVDSERDCGRNPPEFRVHHTNTQATRNEQAGTAISEQPLVARVIGSLLDK